MSAWRALQEVGGVNDNGKDKIQVTLEHLTEGARILRE
jgi:hypothetical protein